MPEVRSDLMRQRVFDAWHVRGIRLSVGALLVLFPSL